MAKKQRFAIAEIATEGSPVGCQICQGHSNEKVVTQ